MEFLLSDLTKGRKVHRAAPTSREHDSCCTKSNLIQVGSETSFHWEIHSQKILLLLFFLDPLKTVCEIAFLLLFRLNDFVLNNFCKPNGHVTETKAKTNQLPHFLLFPTCNLPSFQFKLKHHPRWEQNVWSCQLHYSNSVRDSWFFIFFPGEWVFWWSAKLVNTTL